MAETEERQLASHLRALIDRSGLSYREVAKRAGYQGASSIQRYLEDSTIKVLSPSIARKFAQALLGLGKPAIGIRDLARLVSEDTGHNVAQLQSLAILLGIPPVTELAPSSAHPVRSGMLPVMGSAHASNWMEAAPSFEEPEDWLAIPFNNYQPIAGQYVLRIVGPSINLTAPDGHYAICQRYGSAAHTPPNGKFVHVERRRGDFVEWTLKRVRWEGDGMTLWPDSNHPDHQRPIDMGEAGVEVRILGIVVGWYRPA